MSINRLARFRGTIACVSSSGPDSVSVATWNLWWKFGPWEERQTPIGDELAELDADVVCIQEVWATDDGDQAVILAERLGCEVARTVDADGRAELGRLASFVRDTRVPLEMCPTSNVNTGAASSIAEHPIGLLRRLRFRVTVNTDNRLMSNISMTEEMENMVRVFDWDLHDMQWLTVNAMKSAFLPFDERLSLINNVIKPRYAALRANE